MLTEYTTKKQLTPLYEMNQVIRSVYPFYMYNKGVIVPSSMDIVKYPDLFKASIFIHRKPTDHLNGMIDGARFSKASKIPRISNFDKDEKGNLSIVNTNGEKFLYGTSLTEDNISDIDHYVGLQLLKKLKSKFKPTVEYILGDEIRKELIDYGVPTIVLGNDNGVDVKLIATLKLFPGIKRSKKISILAQPYDQTNKDFQNLYHIVCISEGEDWAFYSFHNIINIVN